MPRDGDTCVTAEPAEELAEGGQERSCSAGAADGIRHPTSSDSKGSDDLVGVSGRFVSLHGLQVGFSSDEKISRLIAENLNLVDQVALFS